MPLGAGVQARSDLSHAIMRTRAGPTPLPHQLQQPLFVVQALAILAAIVAVHEAGHFLAARLQRIHVTKFAIGFGPPIFAVQVRAPLTTSRHHLEQLVLF